MSSSSSSSSTIQTLSNNIETNAEIICKVGAINEANFINGLNNKGFTSQHCLGELVANSVDSNAKNIKFNLSEINILLIDDGIGMDETALTNMFEIHRENHKNETKMGRSGLGGKAATKILSENTSVNVFTHTNNGSYLCAVIPWDLIVESGVYIGAISIRLMTPDEITEFNNDRLYFSNTTGTTIQFNYNCSLYSTIFQNFEKNCIKIGDRLEFIFGAFDINIFYAEINKPHLDKKMKLYNYFENDSNKYYNGIKTDTISHYRDEKGKDLFILTTNEEANYIIKSQGTGYKKTAEISKIKKNRLTYIGDFTVLSGMQKLTKYFDIENPILPKTASKLVHDYDAEFINKDDDSAETLAKVGLRRNGQLISYFEIPDCKISSARGNVETMHSTYHVRCVVSYDSISTNNNITDNIIGIQENKNQYQESTLPINFTRLVKYVKQKTAKEIWEYFKEVVSASNKPDEEKDKEKDKESDDIPANKPDDILVNKPDEKPDVFAYFKTTKEESSKNHDNVQPVEQTVEQTVEQITEKKNLIEAYKKSVNISKQDICNILRLLQTAVETINEEDNEIIGWYRWCQQTNEHLQTINK